MLYSQLEILRLPTDQLILRFLSELLEFQRREFERERPLGTLEINLSYNKVESVVEVTVLKGEKFPINGKLMIDLDSHSRRYNLSPSLQPHSTDISGSFVQLSVSPPAAFANSKGLFITSTQKKTVDPVYDQVFKM